MSLPLAEEQRRLTAIMFTDMVGFTALTQSDEAQSLEVLARHNRLLRPIFPRYRGREVKAIGDSFLVEFDSALDATNCAVEVQSFLHDYNISTRDEWKITLRIGIHLGDVVHREGDVFGDAVNVASRLQPLAEPEGICVSDQVYVQVRNKLPQTLVKLEHHDLKGVKFPVDVYKVVMPWDSSAPLAPLDRHRVAVLPFVSISPDPNDEYIADGLTEEMIGRLSVVRGLEVIARTSVMNYKKEKKNASQIGAELKTGTLLEGSVRKAGDRIRVTAQLIDANTEGHLWMESYDRNLEDIFAVQSEVAEKVATSLELKLTADDRKSLRRGETSSPEAHALVLKGRFYARRWDEESLTTANRMFEEALTHDPDYALAYCGLARANSLLGFLEVVESKVAYGKAREYARKALELDPSLPEAHLVFCVSLLNDYDWEGRKKELQTAIELDPNYSEAYAQIASDHAFKGEWAECIKNIKKELELDPLSVQSAGSAGTWYLYAGQYDEAIRHLKNALELDPVNWFYLDNLGLAYIQKGMIDEGLALVRRAWENSHSSVRDLTYALLKAGEQEEVRRILSSLLESYKSGGEGGRAKRVRPLDLAGIYAQLGEKDKAFQLLDEAYERRSGYLPAINGDFVFENLFDDPRFEALLSKMGLHTPSS